MTPQVSMMIDAGSSSPDMTSIPWPQEQIQHHNASMVGTSLAGRSCRMSCARRRRARACAHALLAASDDALPCGGGYSALSSLLPPLVLVGNHCAQLNHENCGTNWFLNRLSVSLVAWVGFKPKPGETRPRTWLPKVPNCCRWQQLANPRKGVAKWRRNNQAKWKR